MAETNAVLGSLMARPEATQNYVSIADMMRNRALAQQQISASQTGQQLTEQQIESARMQNEIQRSVVGMYAEMADPDFQKNVDAYKPGTSGNSGAAARTPDQSAAVAPASPAPGPVVPGQIIPAKITPTQATPAQFIPPQAWPSGTSSFLPAPGPSLGEAMNGAIPPLHAPQVAPSAPAQPIQSGPAPRAVPGHATGSDYIDKLTQYWLSKGKSPIAIQTVLAPMIQHLQASANLSKTDLENRTSENKLRTESLGTIQDTLAGIQSKMEINPATGQPNDPTGAQSALEEAKNYWSQHEDEFPGIDLKPFEQMTLDHLPIVAGGASLALKTAELDTKELTARKTQAETTEAGLKVEKPTDAQLDTFTTKTLPSFENVTPAQQKAFASEAKEARTVPEFNAIVARADATDKAMQIHADSLAQTRAIVGNKFADAGVTANEKMWTDPQRGFAGALAQANQTKQSIVAGANGNALLTAMVPTMEVLGINHAAGISRISPQEAQAAGASPEWATRWNAFATKAATGKLTPELAKEGQQLMDIVVDAAYAKALSSSQFIAKGHGLTPEQTVAMDRSGKITTLDKVMSGARGGASQAKIYTQADVDAAVAAHPGLTAAQANASFKAKGWNKQ